MSDIPDDIAHKCDEICERLANGMSLASICRMDHMPASNTVYKWIRQYETFRTMYTLARMDQADTIADEMLDIADNSTNDWMENNDSENPGYKLNGENIQRARLRIDTRKWYASKLKPKSYGDKLDHNIGGQEDNPIVQRIERVIIEPTNTDSEDI